MTKLERAELVVISGVGFLALFAAQLLPGEIGFGKLLIWCSGLLLFQSLVRDLVILAIRRNTKNELEQREEPLMCLESTVGVVGIIVGSGVLFSGVDLSLPLPGERWMLIVLFVLWLGFWLKDYVFSWKSWRIKKEKDHLNILVRWK